LSNLLFSDGFAFIDDLTLLSCSFQYFSLFSVVNALTIICHGEVLFWSYLFGVLRVSCTWMGISLSRFGVSCYFILFIFLLCPYAFSIHLFFFQAHDFVGLVFSWSCRVLASSICTSLPSPPFLHLTMLTHLPCLQALKLFSVLEFELRTLHLPGRHSTTWTTSQPSSPDILSSTWSTLLEWFYSFKIYWALFLTFSLTLFQYSVSFFEFLFHILHWSPNFAQLFVCILFELTHLLIHILFFF
jgi:hypothetical protein